METTKRRFFPDEFKRQAVDRVATSGLPLIGDQYLSQQPRDRLRDRHRSVHPERSRAVAL